MFRMNLTTPWTALGIVSYGIFLFYTRKVIKFILLLIHYVCFWLNTPRLSWMCSERNTWSLYSSRIPPWLDSIQNGHWINFSNNESRSFQKHSDCVNYCHTKMLSMSLCLIKDSINSRDLTGPIPFETKYIIALPNVLRFQLKLFFF